MTKVSKLIGTWPAIAGIAFLYTAPSAFLSFPSSHTAYNRISSESQVAEPQPFDAKAVAAADRASQPVMLMGAVVLAGTMALASRRSGASGVAASPKRLATVAMPTSLHALPKIMEGTGGPLATEVWDPAGLMNGRSEEQILHWRAVELKHCRVSMLAIIGWLHVSAGWHFIGDAAAGFRVSDDPLVNVTQVPMGGMWQLVFSLMALEWVSHGPCPPPKERPWDVLGWTPLLVEDEEFKTRQLQELNNGRLAMLGILGLIGQDAFTGDYAAWIHQPNFGQSNPLMWNGEPPFEMAQVFPMTP